MTMTSPSRGQVPSTDGLEMPLTMSHKGWETEDVPGLYWKAESSGNVSQGSAAQDKQAWVLPALADTSSQGIPVLGHQTAGPDTGRGTASPPSALTEAGEDSNAPSPSPYRTDPGLALQIHTGSGTVAGAGRVTGTEKATGTGRGTGTATGTGTVTGSGALSKQPGWVSQASRRGAAGCSWGPAAQGLATGREADSGALLDGSCRHVLPSNNAADCSARITEALARRLNEGSGAVPLTPLWEVQGEPDAQRSGTFAAAGRPLEGGRIQGLSSPPSAVPGPGSFLERELQRLSAHDGLLSRLHSLGPSAPFGHVMGHLTVHPYEGPLAGQGTWQGLGSPVNADRSRIPAEQGAVPPAPAELLRKTSMAGEEAGGSGVARVHHLDPAGAPTDFSHPGPRPSLAGRLAAVLSSIEEREAAEAEAEGEGGVAMTEEDMEALQEMCRRRLAGNAGRAHGMGTHTATEPTTASGLSAGVDVGPSGPRTGAGLSRGSIGGAAPGLEDVRVTGPSTPGASPEASMGASGGDGAPAGLRFSSPDSTKGGGGSKETQGQLQCGPHLQHQEGQHHPQGGHQQGPLQAHQQGGSPPQQHESLQQGQQQQGQQQQRQQQQRQQQQRQQQQRPQAGQELLKQLMALTQEQQQMERRSQKHIILGKDHFPRLQSRATPGTRAPGTKDTPPATRAPGAKDTPLGIQASGTKDTPPGNSRAVRGTLHEREGAEPESGPMPGSASVKRALAPVANCVRPKLLRVFGPMERHSLSPHFQKLVASHLVRLAAAYESNQLDKRQPWVVQLQRAAAPDGPVIQRVAHYFLEALGKRFEGLTQETEPKPILAPPPKQLFASKNESAKAGLKRGWGGFAEAVFTATFLPPLLGREHAHIILFTNGPGPEWALLFKALAARRGAAPRVRVRVTIVTPFDGPLLPPQVQQGYAALGERVRAAALCAGLTLDYNQVFVRPSEYHPSLVSVDPSEALVVGEYLAIHCFPDDSVLRRNPRDACLSWIRELNPLVFTVVGLDANLNSHSYLERFGEVLRLTTAILENFDSTVHDLATSTDRPAATLMERLVTGQLMTCVSSQGLAQTMRAENLHQWQERLASMGFRRVPLAPSVFTALQGASLHPRLSVLPFQGCASLRWDDSPLVFALTARNSGTA